MAKAPGSNEQLLDAHYVNDRTLADVDASLVVLGKTPAAITIEDLEAIDEFHMGGRPATRAVLAACGFARGMTLLDVGSGFGGPARVAATALSCKIQGIDLTKFYVDVATELSRRVGLDHATQFAVGSALAMPFASNAFDGAYMFHVGMNIADKFALMREVARVLKPGATFGVYDIMRIGAGDLTFPLPWSSVPTTSAVVTAAEYCEALKQAGLEIVSEQDRRALVRGSGQATPQTLPHRGPLWETKVANLAAMVREGRLSPVEIIARRTA